MRRAAEGEVVERGDVGGNYEVDLSPQWDWLRNNYRIHSSSKVDALDAAWKIHSAQKDWTYPEAWADFNAGWNAAKDHFTKQPK